MAETDTLKLLFIINSGAGTNTTNWAMVINSYFEFSKHHIELYHLFKGENVKVIKEKIAEFSPQRVIAVGGDGTVKLVAECLLGTNIALGILPAGSANGLARELGISDNPTEALNTLVNGYQRKIHITHINNRLCIHLSDIGLNAYAMKRFKSQRVRGMWGYLMASLHVLWQNPQMEVEIQIDKKTIKIKAAMIVIANATKYGTGVVINPIGKLDDQLFEVVVIKKIAFRELFKVVFSGASYDSETIEIFQTNQLLMRSKKRVHFQIDGEYFGKVKQVKAILVPDALEVITPAFRVLKN